MTGSTSPPGFTFRHYQYILETALHAGYRFIAFDDLAGRRPSDELLCLLRHDCEGDLVAAARLGEIEQALGVMSTYFVQLRSPLYNALSTPHAALIRGLLERGHRLGLHFDERSRAHAAPGQVADLVDGERTLLAAEFGVPVTVVSFHQPSPAVLENRIKLRCLNTYDRADMAGVDYLSDSNWTFREDPVDALAARRHPRLQLLLHPECWTEEAMVPEQKWHHVLNNNLEIAQDTLLARELTYKRRARITFRS